MDCTIYDKVLLFGDVHEPYSHPDYIDFLADLNRTYKPDLVVNMGDLLDFHDTSYHPSDPSLPSADEEFELARHKIQNGVCKIFKKFTSLFSNHSDLPLRQARTAKLSQHYIKSHASALGINKNKYIWVPELTINLPTGPLLMVHNRGANITINAKEEGMSMAQGHYHSACKVEWFGGNNPKFGLQVPCLIDRMSYAFRYGVTHKKKPITGAALILNGIPHNEILL